MNPETEVSRVELEAPDAAIAMWSYGVVGYRAISPETDGDLVPQVDEEGCLSLSKCGAIAIQKCLSESIKYNEEHVLAKIAQRLSQRQTILPVSHLNNLLAWREEAEYKVAEMTRVYDLITEKTEKASEENAA